MDYTALKQTFQFVLDWLQNSESIYFFLPDGPYGRPFDSVFVNVGSATEAVDGVFRLSDQIMFKIAGQAACTESDVKLIISGFEKLEFIEDGKAPKLYTSGELCFVRV